MQEIHLSTKTTISRTDLRYLFMLLYLPPNQAWMQLKCVAHHQRSLNMSLRKFEINWILPSVQWLARPARKRPKDSSSTGTISHVGCNQEATCTFGPANKISMGKWFAQLAVEINETFQENLKASSNLLDEQVVLTGAQLRAAVVRILDQPLLEMTSRTLVLDVTQSLDEIDPSSSVQ